MKKIICYGAGGVFPSIIAMLNPRVCEVVAVIDKIEGKNIPLPEHGLVWDIPREWGGRTKSISIIKEIEFDYVLLCSNRYCGQMRENLKELGIANEKIIQATQNDLGFNWVHMYLSLFYQRNASYEHNVLLELTDREIYDFALCRELMLRRERRLTDFQYQIYDDYVRVSTFELLANRIIEQGIEGAIAEAGVYRGDMAARLNEMFVDRELYLFDTFSSFNDEVMEKEEGNASDSFVDMFKDTSVGLVMSKMKHPEKCIVRKGVFPDTTEGIPEMKWAFVSLDMDLYASTYSGLQYFYPRLQKNGYIVVHDCLHHQGRSGKNEMPAGKAVDRFCEENNIQYVPVTDTFGSIIIIK